MKKKFKMQSVTIAIVLLSEMNCEMFQDVVVSPEFKELQKTLERSRQFTVIHGGVLMEKEDYDIQAYTEARESFQRDPFGKLRTYCRKAGYRLIDLFRDLDKDSSMSISREELIYGLKVACIILWDVKDHHHENTHI